MPTTQHEITLAKSGKPDLTLRMTRGRDGAVFRVERYSVSSDFSYFDAESDAAQEFYAQVGVAIVLDGYRCQDIVALALEMGHQIRAMDEEGSASEWWTLDGGNPEDPTDGEYLADSRFPGYADD
jgi:hypothetical protein